MSPSRPQQPPFQPLFNPASRTAPSNAAAARTAAHSRPAPLDLAQAMPLVERALQALERRNVRPQLGLLKSTMLQLDSAFSEKAYGAGSFTDFVEKLQKANYVHVTGGEGRYMIKRIGAVGPEKSTRAAGSGAAGAARRARNAPYGSGRGRADAKCWPSG